MDIFITGISSGIGKDLARLLNTEGYRVWGVARREDLLRQLSTEIASNNFFYSKCDVSDEKQVNDVMRDMSQKKFSPDIVVLNSAIYEKDLLKNDTINCQEVKRVFSINFEGALIWVEKFLPLFLEKKYGKFLAISSTSAFRPDIHSISLPSSKAALSMAFRSLRLRYAPQNIQFVNVYFGPIATPIIPEFTTSKGEKKYFFVLSSNKAAQKLKKALFGQRSEYYYPWGVTFLFRLGLFFPDSLFSKISQFLKN